MATANDELIARFVSTFESKDEEKLGAFFHQNIVFTNYGDSDVHGRVNVAAAGSASSQGSRPSASRQ